MPPAVVELASEDGTVSPLCPLQRPELLGLLTFLAACHLIKERKKETKVRRKTGNLCFFSCNLPGIDLAQKEKANEWAAMVMARKYDCA